MKLPTACLLLVAISSSAVQVTAGREGRRLLLEDLPWSDLRDQLSSSDALVEASVHAYLDECYQPQFRLPRSERTNHHLIEQPSGLCMGHLFCAHKQCLPASDESIWWMQDFQNDPPFSEEAEAVLQEWLDPSNEEYNLPLAVVFPSTAADAIAAVKFAKDNGIKISIKNSGHSYAGSSTMKDTLLINMNKYERYALPSDGDVDLGDLGLTECSKDNETISLDNQPCKLALARGKPAVLRVGGGENFDKSYRAVKKFNEGIPEGYKYHLVGGAAGTVSPMGWTWMGGLSGTTGGRIHGFGVDQVLQIEAVLPNGQHTRFGPTQWEESDGFLVPKTTKVSGECMAEGGWTDCGDDINFDDLWFAFRGGGGGVWGVVLSTYLQLHDYLPFERVSPTESCPLVTTSPTRGTLDLLGMMIEFSLDFYLDPEALNVTKDASNACGLANEFFGVFTCSGAGRGAFVVELWRDFVGQRRAELEQANFSAEDIEIVANCLQMTEFNDYGESIIIDDGPFTGRARDSPPPGYFSDNSFFVNQLVPLEWVKKNKQTMIDFWKFGAAFGLFPPQAYMAFAGNTDLAHDQTSSLSRGHREAGFMFFYHAGFTDAEFLEQFGIPDGVFPEVQEQYNFTGDVIPSYISANHLGPNTYGPLKSDYTQPCPFRLSIEESEKLCVPILEAVYGTETLRRLESIKRAIDPDMVFDCHRCVGNKVLSDDDDSSDSSGLRGSPLGWE